MAKEFEDPAQDLYKKRREKADLNREVEPFTIAAFVMVWFGFFVGFIPFLGQLYFMIVLILAIVGQVRIGTNKKIYRGTGFNIFSITISVLYLLLSFVFLLFMIVSF
ncbi:MAG: hypothetical protein ACOCXG_05750 [Nanoarchaeota archaeon]